MQNLKIRTKTWIGPSRRLDTARNVELRATDMVLEYPDDANAEEIAEIIQELAALRGMPIPEKEKDPEKP